MVSGWCLEQTLIFQNKMIYVLVVQLLSGLEIFKSQKIKYITSFKSFFLLLIMKSNT